MERGVKGLAISRFALHITLSIGVTIATPGETATSMLTRADMALYNAKRSGRNCTRTLPLSIDQGSSDKATASAAAFSVSGYVPMTRNETSA
jgi:predicted signal transduction protein with EAL and GGDEF domain